MSSSSKPQAASPYWEQLFSSREGWGAYPPEELVRFMARNFCAVDRSRTRVLDLGCGPGPNLWYLAREGYCVAGIDGAATALRMARDRLSAEGLPKGSASLELQEGNFVALPWPDQSFDAVIEVAALYANRISEIRQAIAEIHRCLKNGGLFFGKMFGIDTTGSDSGDELEPGTRSHPDRGPCAGNEVAHFFSRSELQMLFKEFEHVAIDSLLRTDKEGEIRIFHWLVTARK
jgi:SAM-dependent methyltransferase